MIGDNSIVRGNTVNTTIGTTEVTYGVFLSTSSASLAKIILLQTRRVLVPLTVFI